MAKSLVLLGGQVSDRQRGLELVTEGLEIFRAEQNSFYTAEGLLYLGLIMDEMGDEARSDAYFEESLALRRQIRDSDGMGFCLYFLGNKDFMRGNYPQARSRLEESAACFQKAGNQVLLSKVFNLLSTFWLAQGDYSIAAQYSEDALEAVRNMTDSAELVSAFNSLAVLAWARGDFANAEQASQEAERAARKINCAYPGDISQWVLGRISLSRGDTAQAEAHLLPLLKAPNLHPMALETARLFDALAGLAVLSGNLQRAAVLLGAAEAATRCWWMVFSPRERSEHQAWQDAVSGRETEDALAQGRAMTFQEMLTFAAAELIN